MPCLGKCQLHIQDERFEIPNITTLSVASSMTSQVGREYRKPGYVEERRNRFEPTGVIPNPVNQQYIAASIFDQPAAGSDLQAIVRSPEQIGVNARGTTRVNRIVSHRKVAIQSGIGDFPQHLDTLLQFFVGNRIGNSEMGILIAEHIARN